MLNHRLDAAVGPAADDDVAGPERSVLHDELGDDAAVFVHLGLQAGATGRAVGVGLVFVQFGHGEQRHDQVIQARALGGAGLHDFRFATPFAGLQLVFRKLAVQAIEIDAGQVDLVEGHDDRHAGRPGVADGLFGLRHDAIVSGDDQHGDVGDVGPAGTHFREGLVTGRIDKGHTRPSLSTLYARICCVMPPFSCAATSRPIIRSNNDVLPWST